MRKKNILCIGNGSNLNRGCEAIIRGIVEVLKKSFGHNIACANIYNVMQQEELSSCDLDGIVHQQAMVIGYQNLQDRIIRGQMLKFFPNLWEKLFLTDLVSPIRKADLVLSVGGDNYSMDYGIPRRFVQQGKLVKRLKKPLVIFGASVGPFNGAGRYEQVILNHLRHEVDLILVREDRSYNYLIENRCENVIRIADPAFLMAPSKPTKTLNIPADKLIGAIGLNISPLVARQNHQGKENPSEWVAQVASRLEAELQRPVLLLYHVTTAHSNDYKLLARAHTLLNGQENIFLLENGLNAQELKWIISRLSCLVGARTHATIAGFSSAIPTVSLAYSVKAWGLNDDLFGHTEYVLPAVESTVEDIVHVTQKVLAENEMIHSCLLEKLTSIRHQAYQAGEHLRDLCDEQ